MASADTLINAFTTLLVTVDPPGLAPLFIGLTAGMNRAERKQVALRGSLIAFFILAAFALFGASVLGVLGISIGAFRIAGGLLLFWIAFEMVFERRTERKQQTADTAITQDHIRNVAAFPLAIPLMAGPGALTAAVLLGGQAGGDWLLRGLFAGIIAIVLLLCLCVFLLSGPIEKLMGERAQNVLGRLLGVLLAALAVQYVADGIAALKVL